MNISSEEKLMYSVMKAIYDSGIPVNFKGSMVLKACLYEAGYTEQTRHTVDIDANWNSGVAPTTEQIADSLQVAIDQAKINLDVTIYRTYDDKRSAGFELKNSQTKEILFTMDIDVNRPQVKTKMYEISGMTFQGVVPVQILADKVAVVSSDKIFRRIKDVVDLYYLSHVIELNADDVMETLIDNGRVIGNFSGFIEMTDELKHSYEKFRFTGDVNRPSFDDIYTSVRTYIEPMIAYAQCYSVGT